MMFIGKTHQHAANCVAATLNAILKGTLGDAKMRGAGATGGDRKGKSSL